MKTFMYALATTALAVTATRAIQKKICELERKKAMPRAKPHDIQEWEGEGGAIFVPATISVSAQAPRMDA